MALSTEKKVNLFNSISRSHLYWGRKPTSGLFKVLESIKPGDIFLDPFCGGGTPTIAALSRGARVIASDLNPMAVFLSKVIIQPIHVFALKEAFESIRADVADSILQNYTISCPRCQESISFDYLKWNNQDGEVIPEAVKIRCDHCGSNEFILLSKDEINIQLQSATMRPQFWFPRNAIRSARKTNVEFFHELFTGRNLTSLAQLYHAIEKVSPVRCRETIQYVFTSMLYSCSTMQMFSQKWPSSSRGWTAPRFYVPLMRQEKNVWKAFENRFKTVLNSKKIMNSICKFVQISDSMDKFESSDDKLYISEKDCLKFLFPKRLDVTHVFLDPPYNDDIDYMGFSEFWSSWLGMASDIQAAWRPGIISVEDNAERLFKLLMRIRENTTSSCSVTLAYGSKKTVAWDLWNETISEAGYDVREEIPIIWDNSQKRGKIPPTDSYLILGRAFNKPKTNGYRLSEEDSNELIRVAAFLRPDISNPEGIINLAFNFVKPHLRIQLRKIKKSQIRSLITDKELNRKAYNRFAFVFIKLILSQDGFRITSANPDQFIYSDLTGYDAINNLPIPRGMAKGADLVAENNQGSKILFCFYDDAKVDALKRISKRIFEEDNDKFRKICYLIVSNHDEMMKCRRVDWADNWPRGFFVDFNKLVKKAKKIDEAHFGHITIMSPKTEFNFRASKKIEHFNARVLENTSIGVNGNPKHFIIRFRAPELKYVVPGQFVMLDTLSKTERKAMDKSQPLDFLATSKSQSSFNHLENLRSKSFLKRPFSIHRAFYKNFKWNYLKNMSLPLTLATITHTVFPDEFEIFYKVIENGTGTNELKELKSDSKFQVLGPLGKITTVSEWRSDGIEEVHLIGGGVGMAPLMFFGQALRYYSFQIKAFIGIDRLDTLLSKAPLAPTFAEDDPKQVYVYIDNLKRIGLHANEIYVSFEKREVVDDITHRLLGINYHNGLVSQQYASYLDKLNRTDNILIITCGPKPMLEELGRITSKAGVRMKVLLEKRMGCGIGVCMSCVCRTRKDDIEQYSRVCTEGPLFDAEDIVWD